MWREWLLGHMPSVMGVCGTNTRGRKREEASLGRENLKALIGPRRQQLQPRHDMTVMCNTCFLTIREL